MRVQYIVMETRLTMRRTSASQPSLSTAVPSYAVLELQKISDNRPYRPTTGPETCPELTTNERSRSKCIRAVL
jgi:hypothetical protein